MNNIFKYSLKGFALSAVAMFGLSSCTDDHFDIFGGEGGTQGQSIWQNIKANDRLTDLQQILSRTYMMRSETDRIDPAKTKTLAQLLDDPQMITVWAPLDGTYDASKYLDVLDEAEAVLAANGGKVTPEYLKLQYQVANQFGYNHIARFNFESIPTEQSIYLLNGKKVSYTATGHSTFNGVDIVEDPILSSNGTLHLLSQPSPFAYNIYDFIVENENLSLLRAQLLDPSVDKYEFSPGASVQGQLNDQGLMVYVDSVYSHTNTLVNNSRARLQDEDSVYVAVLPTDKAWESAVTKLKSYFKYKKTYNFSWSNNNSKFGQTYTFNADSLRDYNVSAAMLESAFFSPSTWHYTGESEMIKTNDSTAVMQYALYADSLISTNHTIFYNSAKGERNPIFGAEGIQPERASNGYVFCMDDYTVQPEYVWMRTEEIAGSNTGRLAQSKSPNCVDRNGNYVTLDALNCDSSVINDTYKINGFQRFERSASASMNVTYRLPNLMSGIYTIKVILAPSRISKDIKSDDMQDRSEYGKFYVQVMDDEVSKTGQDQPLDILEGAKGTSGNNKKRSKDFVIDDNEVKEYVVIPKIQIPYCYYNLPNNIESFLRLKFTLDYDEDAADDGLTNATGLNIFRIIVEPYREKAEASAE